MAGVSTERVWRGDLAAVYLDPIANPPGMLAYCREQHASPRCERAFPKGTRNHPVDPAGLFCEMCVTDNPDEATVRLVDGRWEKAA